MAQPLSRTSSLESHLGQTARSHGVPSLVVADEAGLPMAASSDAVAVDEVAAISALRASGDESRSELVNGRVKARAVDVGGHQVLLGAIGDTAICAAVFDEVEDAVKQTLA